MASAYFGALMNAWQWCSGEISWLLAAIDAHPGLAGWSQFLGAMGAIAAAIMISRHEINTEKLRARERRASKARTLALLLAPSVAQAIVDAGHIRRTIEEEEHGMALMTASSSTWGSAVDAMSFHVPPNRKLLRRVDALPGNTAVKVVQLFSYIDHFNAFISAYLLESRSFDGEGRAYFTSEMDRKFASIETLVVDVKKCLDTIMEPEA